MTADTRADALLIPDTDAARLAGVSRSTLHALRAAGRWGPAPIRLGRCLRFRKADVEAWIGAGCPDARTWQAMRAAEGRRLRCVCQEKHSGAGTVAGQDCHSSPSGSTPERSRL